MSNEFDDRSYCVVVNHEEQYSIWLADSALPNGWRQVGVSRSKADCLTHIEKVWVDMRPLSLRQAMAQATSPTEDIDHDASRLRPDFKRA